MIHQVVLQRCRVLVISRLIFTFHDSIPISILNKTYSKTKSKPVKKKNVLKIYTYRMLTEVQDKILILSVRAHSEQVPLRYHTVV